MAKKSTKKTAKRAAKKPAPGGKKQEPGRTAKKRSIEEMRRERERRDKECWKELDDEPPVGGYTHDIDYWGTGAIDEAENYYRKEMDPIFGQELRSMGLTQAWLGGDQGKAKELIANDILDFHRVCRLEENEFGGLDLTIDLPSPGPPEHDPDRYKRELRIAPFELEEIEGLRGRLRTRWQELHGPDSHIPDCLSTKSERVKRTIQQIRSSEVRASEEATSADNLIGEEHKANRWSDEDIRTLINMNKRNCSLAVIGRSLGRTKNAVKNKLAREAKKQESSCSK